MSEDTQKTGLRDEWFDSDVCNELKFNLGGKGRDDYVEYRQQDVCNWWLEKFTTLQKEMMEDVVAELETNPNPDGSISPNIQHWIERKQSQIRQNLKEKYNIEIK
jgi:hypothetical protein